MINTIKFDERGLVPAIIQDYQSGQVLMMAYMNAESLEKTIQKRENMVLLAQPSIPLDEGGVLRSYPGC